MPASAISFKTASIEAAMATLSNCNEIATDEVIVVYITSENGGSSIRYNDFSGISEDFISALQEENAAAISVHDMSALEVLKVNTREIVRDNQGVLEIRLRAFQFGEKILDELYAAPFT